MRAKAIAASVLVALAVASCGKEDLHGAPNVKGLTLDVARAKLKAAGWGVSVKDDAVFGALIESHFTVCKEHSPNGKLVPIDVSKNCQN